jgi:transposase
LGVAADRRTRLGAHQEASALTKELRALVQAMAPALLAQPGVGPVTAAQLLISWSHHGRLRPEAAFAMLAGVAPIPASSGLVVRHRLNRGGDRQLNRALHTIVMIREARHEPTNAIWPAAPPRARADVRSAAAWPVPPTASCFGCWSASRQQPGSRAR